MLTTLHGRLDLPELGPIFREYADMQLVSISDASVFRFLMPRATVHRQGSISPSEMNPILSVHWRGHPESGPIMRLKLPNGWDSAANRGESGSGRSGILCDEDCAVDGSSLDRIPRRISDAEKGHFLGDAAAVLCTHDWPEPFGIVLIEALACGTLVFAYRRGSIPEIIEDGVTGFICDSLDEMAKIDRLPLIKRSVSQESFQARFTAERMVRLSACMNGWRRCRRERTRSPTDGPSHGRSQACGRQ